MPSHIIRGILMKFIWKMMTLLKMVWAAWNQTAPILPIQIKFVKPIVWVLINEIRFLLGCLHIEPYTATPLNLLPEAILVRQVRLHHFYLSPKGKNDFQNATCTPRVKLLKLSLKFWCSLKRYDVFLKHSFFMLVRSWMMCNFILMRNFRYWRRCNSNDRRLLSMVALMIDDIKHLIEIEPNTKISKLIHKMRVFQSIGILKWHLKKVFAVLCVLLFMPYHWYQDGWNRVKSHVSEIPSSSSTKWKFGPQTFGTETDWMKRSFGLPSYITQPFQFWPV